MEQKIKIIPERTEKNINIDKEPLLMNVEGTLKITEDGQYDVSYYSDVDIDVVDGEIDITEDGNYDVTHYETAKVKTTDGTIEITANGNYDVKRYENANVDIFVDPYQKWKEYIASKDSWQYLFAYNSNNSFDEYIADLNLNNLYNNTITSLFYMFSWNSSLTELHNFKPIGATNMSYMFNMCQNLVEITGFDTSTVTDFRDIFNYCGKLKTVKTLDTSHSAYDLTIFNKTYVLTDIEFVPNSIKRKISFQNTAYLTNDSLISIANGLDANATTKELTLNATPKGRLNSIMGTNIDGEFVADGGDDSLQDFITNEKGWSVL